MSVRMRNCLNLGALVAAAFLGGLMFRGSKQGGTAASALSDAFATAALQVKPAVVLIQSEQVERGDGQPLPPGSRDRSIQFGQRLQVNQGSGFVVSADGYILTNSHLVATAARVTVRLYDKRELPAQVVGTDPSTDVAVLKIDARDLPTAQFGNSDSTRVGDWALAIGNPLGETFAFTVTAGIISAKGRVLAGLQQSRSSIQDYLQTDAATNPGNSGGPLVDTRGQVVGINSAIASGTGFYIGYGLAIPINLARVVMDQLIRTGRVARTALGLSIREATQEDASAVGSQRVTGVVVSRYTSPDSPARRAGIQPGDVIVLLDGAPVETPPELQEQIEFRQPGEIVAIGVLRRGGGKKTIRVRLERAPGEVDGPVVTASRLWYGGTLAPVTVFARAPRRQDSTAVANNPDSSRHAVD
jgi:serine protease Do